MIFVVNIHKRGLPLALKRLILLLKIKQRAVRVGASSGLIFFVSFLASRQDNEKPLRLEQYQLIFALPGRLFILFQKRIQKLYCKR